MAEHETPRPIIEIHSGDRMLFCFNREFTQEELEHFRTLLSGKFPGVDIGLMEGVTGVVVYRKETEGT